MVVYRTFLLWFLFPVLCAIPLDQDTVTIAAQKGKVVLDAKQIDLRDVEPKGKEGVEYPTAEPTVHQDPLHCHTWDRREELAKAQAQTMAGWVPYGNNWMIPQTSMMQLNLFSGGSSVQGFTPLQGSLSQLMHSRMHPHAPACMQHARTPFEARQQQFSRSMAEDGWFEARANVAKAYDPIARLVPNGIVDRIDAQATAMQQEWELKEFEERLEAMAEAAYAVEDAARDIMVPGNWTRK